jgi:hypothetical protein
MRYSNPHRRLDAVLGVPAQDWANARAAVTQFLLQHPEKEWVDDSELATVHPLLRDASIRGALLKDLGLVVRV